MSASSYSSAVQELYISYFGRPADAAGLTNFENALAAINAPTNIADLAASYSSNTAIKNLIDAFGTSAESAALYGNIGGSMLSVDAFVTAVFQNVLGRAPQAAGLNFWADAIVLGQLSPGDAALAIAAGALTNTTEQGKLDALTLENKVAIANEFTAGVSDAVGLAEYKGAAAAAIGRGLLAGVNSSTNLPGYATNVQQAVASIDNPTSAPAPAPVPDTFELTTSVDSYTANSGHNAVINGILDNSAGLAASGPAATLTTGDHIVGNGTSTTFNITDEGLGSTMLLPTATISGITTLNISSTEGVGTQDFSAWTTLAAVNVTQSSGPTMLTVDSAAAVNLNETGGSGAIVVNGGASVAITTDSSPTVTVNGGSTTADVSINGGNGDTIVDSHYGSATANTIATVTLTNQGNDATIESNALSTLNIVDNTNGYTVTAAASGGAAPALTLNLDNDQYGNIYVDSASSLTVNAVTAASTIFLSANAATSITFNDSTDSSMVLSLEQVIAPNASNITITGSGIFRADLSGAGASAAIDASTSSGSNLVTLAPGQSFTGGTGDSFVTIAGGLPTGTLDGGSATTGNILDLSNAALGSNATLSASGFQSLEFTGTTSGTLTLTGPWASTISELTFNGAGGDLAVDGLSTVGTYDLIVSDTHQIVVSLAADFGNTDTPLVNVGTQNTAGLNIADFAILDVDGYTGMNLDLVSRSASNQTNEIAVLDAWSIDPHTQTGTSTLSVSGNAPLQIDNQQDVYNPSISVDNISSGKLTLAGGIAVPTTDASDTLGFSGTGATELASFTSSAASLTINGSATNTVNIDAINDTSLTTLTVNNTGNTMTIGESTLSALQTVNLNGSGAMILTVDGQTGSSTVLGGNADITFTSNGDTASGETESFTLGNGNNTITVNSGDAGSTHTYVLGTGSNAINDYTLGSVTASITGAAGVIENVTAYAASSISVTAGNGINYVNAPGNGVTGTVSVGTGHNSIILGNDADVSVTVASHTTVTQDFLVLGTTGTSTTTFVQVTGLNNIGNDMLNFSGASAATLTGFAQVIASDVTGSGGSTGTFADWVAAADGKTGSTAAALTNTNTVTWFQFDGNTYLVESPNSPHSDAGVMQVGNTLVELIGTGYTFNTPNGSSGTVHFLG